MTTKEASGDLPAIPDVTLHRELARGGMGIVYRGRQEFLERDVAVKVLAPQLQGERFAARFRREAKLLAGIKDPHIVACHAAGVTPAGQHYLIMELVEGPSLELWIARHGPVPVRSAVRVVSELASALGHARDLGVIHRDIKTANILLDAPTGTAIDPLFPFVPKLVDLGLARMIASSTDLAQTAPGAVMGTPATMAPEQFDAPDAVDFRADIYGLGCVLYEMLTGAPAYTSERLTDLVVAKRQPRGPDPCERGQDIPSPLGQLVAAMLAQNPDDRPADYSALRVQLEAAAKVPIGTAMLPGDQRQKAGPNLLQTAEFEFLAEGRDLPTAASADRSTAFASRVVEPAAAPAIQRPRVIGPRAPATGSVPRRFRVWLPTGVAACVIALAAFPFLRHPPVGTPPQPSAPPPVAKDPPLQHRPEVELLGLDSAVPRGKAVLLSSRASDADGDALRYEWTVKPAGAVVLSSPTEATTAMRHDLLPGDEFTIGLTVSDAHAKSSVERQVVVRYEPTNLLIGFLAGESPWQPAIRSRAAWRQREDGAVIAAADELPCLRTRSLTGSVWRVGGKVLPERAEFRRGGHDAPVQAGVCLRVAPQRQLAILCTREGPNGERWTLSVQQVVREDGRVGFGLRPLPEAAKAGLAATNVTGAAFSLTRRGNELRIQLGFVGRKERGEHVEALRDDLGEVPLSLLARGGRVLFPELLLW